VPYIYKLRNNHTVGDINFDYLCKSYQNGRLSPLFTRKNNLDYLKHVSLNNVL